MKFIFNIEKSLKKNFEFIKKYLSVRNIFLLIIVITIIAISFIYFSQPKKPSHLILRKEKRYASTMTIGRPDAKNLLSAYLDINCKDCIDIFNNLIPKLDSQYGRNGNLEIAYELIDKTKTDATKQISIGFTCSYSQGLEYKYLQSIYKYIKDNPKYLKDNFSKKIPILNEKIDDFLKDLGLSGANKDSYKTCLNTSTNYQATRNITDKLFAANITKTPLLFINDTEIDNSIINNQDKLFNFINDEIKRNN